MNKEHSFFINEMFGHKELTNLSRNTDLSDTLFLLNHFTYRLRIQLTHSTNSSYTPSHYNTTFKFSDRLTLFALIRFLHSLCSPLLQVYQRMDKLIQTIESCD